MESYEFESHQDYVGFFSPGRLTFRARNDMVLAGQDYSAKLYLLQQCLFHFFYIFFLGCSSNYLTNTTCAVVIRLG